MTRVDRLSNSQREIANYAKAAFDQLWRSAAHLPPIDFQHQLERLVPALVAEYGNLAATAAAEWYEETRAAALGGQFTARVQQANLDAVRGSVKWAGGDLFGNTPDPAKARHKLGEAVQRHVHNTGRATIGENMRRDPAKPRWARMMRGRETCGWCRMLASRGFVYASADSAGAEHDWHDRCDCEPVPDFTLTNAQRASYERERTALEDQYHDVRSRLTGRITDAEVAAEWNRSMVDYDAVREQLAKQRDGRFIDGTITRDAWDGYRRTVLEDLVRERPDGYLGTDRFLPRNPVQPPAGWPKDAPILNAKHWNHILYGDGQRAGGHLDGFGWINPLADGSRRSEFPPDWNEDRISDAILRTIHTDPVEQTSKKYRHEAAIDGINVRVIVSKRSNGQLIITGAYPV